MAFLLSAQSSASWSETGNDLATGMPKSFPRLMLSNSNAQPEAGRGNRYLTTEHASVPYRLRIWRAALCDHTPSRLTVDPEATVVS